VFAGALGAEAEDIGEWGDFGSVFEGVETGDAEDVEEAALSD
tara:strand:- start:315 stop:440 length:126 start_codon:yes stop_codon:yes gene_type:complete